MFVLFLIIVGIWAPFFAFLLAAPFFFIIGLIMYAAALASGKQYHGWVWIGGMGGRPGGGGFGGFRGGTGGGGGASGGW